MEAGKTCCFTGHRPQKLPFGYDEHDVRCVRLKERMKAEIIRLIEHCGVTDFISGMAIGVDMYAAEIVLGLKKQYPYIRLEAAVPCEKQEIKWSAAMRLRYRNILEKCDHVSVLQGDYTPGCMQRRNEYMVNKSDYMLAVWNMSASGTGNTVKYAQHCGLETVILSPDEQ